MPQIILIKSDCVPQSAEVRQHLCTLWKLEPAALPESKPWDALISAIFSAFKRGIAAVNSKGSEKLTRKWTPKIKKKTVTFKLGEAGQFEIEGAPEIAHEFAAIDAMLRDAETNIGPNVLRLGPTFDAWLEKFSAPPAPEKA